MKDQETNDQETNDQETNRRAVMQEFHTLTRGLECPHCVECYNQQRHKNLLIMKDQEIKRRAVMHKPLIARLDGRAFHTLTRGLERPDCVEFGQLMIDTATAVLKHCGASIAYVHSDEILLLFNAGENDLWLGGNFQKLCSVLASVATYNFVSLLDTRLETRLKVIKGRPVSFDCRCWQVETLDDVKHVFFMRRDDAERNAISSIARAKFGRTIENMSTQHRLELICEKGFTAKDFFEKIPINNNEAATLLRCLNPINDNSGTTLLNCLDMSRYDYAKTLSIMNLFCAETEIQQTLELFYSMHFLYGTLLTRRIRGKVMQKGWHQWDELFGCCRDCFEYGLILGHV